MGRQKRMHNSISMYFLLTANLHSHIGHISSGNISGHVRKRIEESEEIVFGPITFHCRAVKPTEINITASVSEIILYGA